MADDSRDKESTTSSPQFPGAISNFPKRNAQGIVLGKDGKPCRSCTSFADFASATKSKSKATLIPLAPPPDCPPDVEVLGRSSWTLLHSLTASYPVAPTHAQQTQVQQFMGLFSKLYPCWVCAEDFQVFMERNKIRTESREEFGRWMCEAHNEVNIKLGKKEFDCGKWEERWRTGWKDGRCD